MRNIWQERAVQKVVAIPCLFVRITFCIHTSTKHLLINFRLDVSDHDKKSRDRSSIETETREVKHTRAQQPLTTFRYYTLSQLSEETSAFFMVCDCSHTVPLIGYSLSLSVYIDPWTNDQLSRSYKDCSAHLVYVYRWFDWRSLHIVMPFECAILFARFVTPLQLSRTIPYHKRPIQPIETISTILRVPESLKTLR